MNNLKIIFLATLTGVGFLGLTNGNLDHTVRSKTNSNYISIRDVNDNVSIDVQSQQDIENHINEIRSEIETNINKIGEAYRNNEITKNVYLKGKEMLIENGKKQQENFMQTIKAYALSQLRAVEDLYNENEINFSDYRNGGHAAIELARRNIKNLHSPLDYNNPLDVNIEGNDELSQAQLDEIERVAELFEQEVGKALENKTQPLEYLNDIDGRIITAKVENTLGLYVRTFLNRIEQIIDNKIQEIRDNQEESQEQSQDNNTEDENQEDDTEDQEENLDEEFEDDFGGLFDSLFKGMDGQF